MPLMSWFLTLSIDDDRRMIVALSLSHMGGGTSGFGCTELFPVGITTISWVAASYSKKWKFSHEVTFSASVEAKYTYSVMNYQFHEEIFYLCSLVLFLSIRLHCNVVIGKMGVNETGYTPVTSLTLNIRNIKLLNYLYTYIGKSIMLSHLVRVRCFSAPTCLCIIFILLHHLPVRVPWCHAFGSPGRPSRGMEGGGNNLGPTIIACNKSPLDVDAYDVIHLLQKVRGGNGGSSDPPALLSIISEFWNLTFLRASSTIRNIFSKNTQKENDLLAKLKTMPVRAVIVPNSTVLPPEVVRMAVKRSGLVGSPLHADRVQDIARTIKRWYVRNGFILHSVTGANLKAETATAEITLDEPTVSTTPVEITVCKEMVVDDTGKLLTFRQYLDQQATRKNFRHDRVEKKDLNTTFVETSGRTKPSKVAKALQLRPGSPFQWSDALWGKVASSGVFGKVLRVAPRRMDDGTVQLQVIATEPPPRHLEYGLGKSLYTGSWEGEVDFEHQNLFGGGEVLGLMVRRGTKDTEPSIRLRYSDDRFGLDGGFDMEVFSDFLGDASTTDSDHHPDMSQEYHEDELCFRKGTTLRVRNPVSTSIIRHTMASASLERTSSRTGKHEKIGSGSIALGPLRMPLPFDARSTFLTTITGGARMGKRQDEDGSILPFMSGSATTRQILPLVDLKKGQGLIPVLALQHTIATSSRHLPSHEVKAMGISAQIRGCGPDGGVMSSVKGTAELRFPIRYRRLDNASVVFFGDWYVVQKKLSESFTGKSSIGVGFRKIVQGLPLKYDFCYTSDGKIKTMFGLGPDFDA